MALASSTAAAIFCTAWVRSGRPPLPKIAVVGPSTAVSLREYDLVAEVVSDGSGAAKLTLDLSAAGVAGKRVLLPRGAQGRPDLREGLRTLGCAVEEIVLYDTIPIPPQLPENLGKFHWVVFFSPSAVTGWCLQPPQRQAVAERYVALGKTTAVALEAAGLRVSVIAADPSAAGVAEAIALDAASLRLGR